MIQENLKYLKIFLEKNTTSNIFGIAKDKTSLKIDEYIKKLKNDYWNICLYDEPKTRRSKGGFKLGVCNTIPLVHQAGTVFKSNDYSLKVFSDNSPEMTHFMKLYPGHNSVITRSDNEEDSQNIIWPSEPAMLLQKRTQTIHFIYYMTAFKYLINHISGAFC